MQDDSPLYDPFGDEPLKLRGFSLEESAEEEEEERLTISIRDPWTQCCVPNWRKSIGDENGIIDPRQVAVQSELPLGCFP